LEGEKGGGSKSKQLYGKAGFIGLKRGRKKAKQRFFQGKPSNKGGGGGKKASNDNAFRKKKRCFHIWLWDRRKSRGNVKSSPKSENSRNTKRRNGRESKKGGRGKLKVLEIRHAATLLERD